MLYPYQQFDLDDLPGESWKDLPFLDGLYRISCYGRVKRLEVEVHNVRGYSYWLNSRILRAHADMQKNNTVNDITYFLSVSVGYAGVRYKFSIERLVYYCFVKKFALDDYSLVVFAKDGNGKNIKPSNLELADLNRKQQRVIERGRYIRVIESTYDEYFTWGRIKSKNPFCRQVSQYTIKGEFIQTFPSIRVAESITGVRVSGISSVLKKRQISSGGYVWGYGRKKRVDVAGIRKENIERRNRMVGQKVTQYTLKGKRIASYFTISEAARNVGSRTGDICAVFSGKQASAGGYIWRKGFGKPQMNTGGILTGNALKSFRRQKKVKQFTSTRKYIQTFPSVKAAAKFLKIDNRKMSRVIKKGMEVKGYLWKFAK